MEVAVVLINFTKLLKFFRKALSQNTSRQPILIINAQTTYLNIALGHLLLNLTEMEIINPNLHETISLTVQTFELMDIDT